MSTRFISPVAVLAMMKREHIPEGIPETKRELKEKKESRIGVKAAAEGSPEAGGEGGPPD